MVDNGASVPDQALVSDQAASRLAPTGFDPSRMDRRTIQQAYIRVCRDSGFQIVEHYAKRRNKTTLAGAAGLKWERK